MSKVIWWAVAAALIFAGGAQAQEFGPRKGGPPRPPELCEAFPWDEPVEQTFTVAAVLHWRRAEPPIQPGAKTPRR